MKHRTRRGYIPVAAALSLALAIPVATAHADPSPQTPQGETSPQTPGGQSSPQTPEVPAPAAPYEPPQRVVPAPPSTSSWQQAPQATYPQSYNPAIDVPAAPTLAVPEVPRIAPEPETLRLGNIVIPEKDIPNIPDKAAWIGSGNEWFAYAESEIATNLVRVGIPKDDASRRAAAAVIGLVAGGVTGGAIAFTATALVVGVVTIPLATLIGTGIGTAVGAFVPVPVPGITALSGAGIGAGVGAASGVAITFFAAAVAGLAVGTATGILGAAVAHALGAGDPGSDLDRPDLPWDQEPQGREERAAAGADQFRVALTADDAAQAGLPGVEFNYQVNAGGDVNIDGSILGHNITSGWTAEQAAAPLAVLGSAAPRAEQVINDSVHAVADALSTHVPELHVSWPQEINTSAGHTQP